MKIPSLWGSVLLVALALPVFLEMHLFALWCLTQVLLLAGCIVVGNLMLVWWGGSTIVRWVRGVT